MHWSKLLFVGFALVLYLEVPIARATLNNIQDVQDQVDSDPGALGRILICEEGDLPFEIPLLEPFEQPVLPFPIDLDTRTLRNITIPPPFRPLNSSFRLPRPFLEIGLDPFRYAQIAAELLTFLGRDVNETFQSISDPRPGLDPNEDLPTPCQLTLAETQMDNNQLTAFGIAELINVTAVRNGLPLETFSSDDLNVIRRVFQGLNCYIVGAWQDAGPYFFPRYFISSNCVRKDCAVPDQRGMFCQPDLSAEAIARLTAVRWDCCHSFDRQSRERIFRCGWRKVSFPLVCDCDCACDRQE